MRDAQGGLKFLAIGPAGHDRWQLPKGIVERGEDPRDTAAREVREEGGVQAEIVAQLPPITYFFHMQGRRYHKTVDFFLMRARGESGTHDAEVDEVRWFPADELDRLAFENERQVVARALEAHRTMIRDDA